MLGGDHAVLQDYLSDLALDLMSLLSAELVYCVNFVVSVLFSMVGCHRVATVLYAMIAYFSMASSADKYELG